MGVCPMLMYHWNQLIKQILVMQNNWTNSPYAEKKLYGVRNECLIIGTQMFSLES